MNLQNGIGLGRWKPRAAILLLLSLSLVARAQNSPLTLRNHWPGYPSSSWVQAALVGDWAYVTGAGAFYVLNVTNPAQLQVLSYSEDLARADLAFEVLPPYAYAVSTTGSDLLLRIIAVSNPANPVLVGGCTNHFPEESGRGQFRVVGSHAYLAGVFSGLHVFDVSDPARPMRVGSYRSDGYGEFGVDVVGRYAYVTHVHGGDLHGGLDIVNVSDPSQPFAVGSCDLPAGYAHQVRVAGDYAYVVGNDNFSGRLYVIDIRDPAGPLFVGECSYGSPMFHTALCVQGPYAFTGGGYEVNVIDLRDPAHPNPLGAYQTPTANGDVSITLAGDRLCLGGSDTVEILDLADPVRPALLGALSFLRTGDVCVEGAVAYSRMTYSAGQFDSPVFNAIDVGEPANPVLLGRWSMASTAFRVSGNRAYLAESDATSMDVYLNILDLTDPGRPTGLGRWNGASVGINGRLNSVFVLGQQYVLATGSFYPTLAGDPRDHFLIFDVRNPAHPVVVGRYIFDSTSTIGLGCIQVADNCAYLRTCDLGLVVLDIGQKANPILLGHSEPFEWVGSFGLASAGRWAYVADSTRGLRVIDVGDPAHPIQAALFQPNDTEIWDVQVIGQYAVASGRSTASSPTRGYLAVLGVADPTQPTLVAEYQTKGEWAPDIEAVGNRLHVANDNWGLAIYDFVPPDVPPRLRLNPPVISGGKLVLTWEGSAGIQLQQTTSLTTPDWQDVAGSEGVSQIELPCDAAAAFFRLIQP